MTAPTALTASGAPTRNATSPGCAKLRRGTRVRITGNPLQTGIVGAEERGASLRAVNRPQIVDQLTSARPPPQNKGIDEFGQSATLHAFDAQQGLIRCVLIE